MLAVEPDHAATPNEYLPLFHRYITRSIDVLAARLGPDLEALTNDLREHAWHLLDYALKLPHLWQSARDLLLALAPRMERDGFRHEWLPFLERGLVCAQHAGDVAGEAQLALYMGRLFRLRADYAAANRWLADSAAHFRHIHDTAGRAQALNQLAYVARLQNNYDLAQTYIDEAFSLLDVDDPERASSHWVLGTMAASLLKWEEAEHHHGTALEIWRAAGDQQRTAWSLQNVGNSYRGRGRYAEAIEYIQRAIVLLGQLHDPVNQAIARMNRGVVHIYDEDPTQALALLQLAEPVFRQVGDQLHLLMVYTNLTIVQRDLGMLELSEQTGKRAIYHGEVLADFKMLANAWDELGQTYRVQGRNAEAVAAFETGLDYIGRVAPDPFQKMVQSSLLTHLEEVKGLGDT